MKTSKLELIQSISEQQQKTDQLQIKLHNLSETLINFEALIDQSEQPIIKSSTLLQEVHHTTITIKSLLSSISTEIENLSTQELKSLTDRYTKQIETFQAQLAAIDITKISKVQSSIDSFSTSIHALQSEINSQLMNISINQAQLQTHIQTQVQQAITNQVPQIESAIHILIKKKLDTQRATYSLLIMMGLGVLILLTTIYLGYQANINRNTIAAQQEIIQYNSRAITNQIKDLNNLRK